MNTEQWFEKAIAYFSSEMTPEEAKLFEAETAASEEWSQLMQLWKTTESEAAIYEQFKEEATALVDTHQKLKHDLVDEDAEHKFSLIKRETAKSSRKVIFSVWQWMAVAAVLTGVIFGVDLLINLSGRQTPVVQTIPKQNDSITLPGTKNGISASQDSEDVAMAPKKNQAAVLYAQAFRPDEIPDDPNGPLDDAFFYYASAQYNNAVTAIDDFRTKAATRGDNAPTPLTEFYASYYKALSLMSLNNPNDAIPLLQQALLQSPADILSARTQWYLSLAYLKEEKMAAASETLKAVVKNPGAGSYRDKAEKLLIKINE